MSGMNEKNHEAVSAGGVPREIVKGELIDFTGSNTERRSHPPTIGSSKEITIAAKSYDKGSNSDTGINNARRLDVFPASNANKSHRTEDQKKIKRHEQAKIRGGKSETNQMMLNIRSSRAKKATEGAYASRGKMKAVAEDLPPPPPPPPPSPPLSTPPPANIVSESRDENAVSSKCTADNNHGKERSSEPPKDLRCESAMCFDACCGYLVGISNDVGAGCGTIHTSVTAVRARTTEWIEATRACLVANDSGGCQPACDSLSIIEGNDEASASSGLTKGTRLSMHCVEWTEADCVSGKNDYVHSEGSKKSKWRQLFVRKRVMKLSTPTTNGQHHDAPEGKDGSKARSFDSTPSYSTRVKNNETGNVLFNGTSDGDGEGTTELGAAKPAEASEASEFDLNYSAHGMAVESAGTSGAGTPSYNAPVSGYLVGAVKPSEPSDPSSVFDHKCSADGMAVASVGTGDTSTRFCNTSVQGSSPEAVKLPEASDPSSAFDRNYGAHDAMVASVGTGDVPTGNDFATENDGGNNAGAREQGAGKGISPWGKYFHKRVSKVEAAPPKHLKPNVASGERDEDDFHTGKKGGDNAGANEPGDNKRISPWRKYFSKRASKVETAPPTHLKPHASGESDEEKTCSIISTSFVKGMSYGDNNGGTEIGGEEDNDDSSSSSSSSMKRNSRLRNAVIQPETVSATSRSDRDSAVRRASSTRLRQASEKHIHHAASATNKDQLDEASWATDADKTISYGAVARSDNSLSGSSLQPSTKAFSPRDRSGSASSTRLRQASEKSLFHHAASARKKDQPDDASWPTGANRDIDLSGSSLQSSVRASISSSPLGSSSTSSISTLMLMRQTESAIESSSILRNQGSLILNRST
jgi:hypothetical protein